MTNKQRIPNLFLIGAPKCGTTAMSSYLADHPDIFISETVGVKEPYYFCSDLPTLHIRNRITSWHDYKGLFTQVNSSVRYAGEATAVYLYSRAAVPSILASYPDPKFIVMLRNPIEIATSFHNQRRKSGLDVKSFEKTWNLQHARAKGKELPTHFRDGVLLQYGEIAKLGKQVERLFTNVPKRDVCFVVYDDFARDPDASYHKVLDFLELPTDHRQNFEALNPSVTYRWQGLETGLKKIRRWRIQLGVPGGMGIHAAINRLNAKAGRRPLETSMRNHLRDYFRDDVVLLSDLLGHDFTRWLH